MTKILKTTALAALLMGTVYGAQAETPHPVNEWKQDIANVVKVCKANEKKHRILFMSIRLGE